MRQKVLLALSVIFLLSFVLPSYAFSQDATSAGKLPNRKQALQERMQERKAALQAKREELQATRSARKEEFKQKREEFKVKLQAIRDEKKQAVVERIDAKMATVNANRTARFTSALSKLQSLLERIQEKAATEDSNGKDTTFLDTAIANAQSSIDTASNAVAAQSQKEYIISINQESALKSTVGSTTKQLEQDLKETHKLVVIAKQAVQNARRELGKLRGEKTEISSPSSSTQ